MTEPKVGLLAITASFLIPQVGIAQVAPRLENTTRLEAGSLALNSSAQSPIPMSVWRVAPATAFRGSLGSLSATSAAWLQNNSWRLADAALGGTLVAPAIYGVRAEMSGNVSRVFDERSFGTDQVDVQTRFNVQFNQHAGAWLGGGVARPWRVAVASTVDLFNAGVWMDRGRASATATLTGFSLTKIAGDDGFGDIGPCSTAAPSIATTPAVGGVSADGSGIGGVFLASPNCRQKSRVIDAAVTGHWDLDRLELSGEAGRRSGHLDEVTPSRYWANGTLTMWVAPRAAFVAGGGRQPSNPARGLPARTFGSIGMVLAVLPPSRHSVPVTPVTRVRAFESKSAANGMQTIVVRVGGVESVDVMGDFSDWAPLTMVRHGRDMWELTVPIAAGVHQINIRTDGGKWLAPPGLPTANDMFSGEVGVLIVKK